jgi:hypothetical protein
MFGRIPLLCLSVGLYCFGTAASHAADQQDAEAAPLDPTSGWVFQVTPYLWAAGIKGDISPFKAAPTISIDKSFSDIFEDLNFGGFVNFYARKDRFVFNGDVMYVNTTDNKVIGALPVIGPTPGLSADVDTVEFTSTLQAGYRLYDTPQLTFDLFAGGRIWYISNDVTVKYAGFSRSYGESFAWVDPIVATRIFYNATDKLSFLFQGDIGGFGAASDFTWQALGTVNYTINDKWAVSAGYKVLSVDYEKDGHVFDTTLSGPVLGTTYRF